MYTRTIFKALTVLSVAVMVLPTLGIYSYLLWDVIGDPMITIAVAAGAAVGMLFMQSLGNILLAWYLNWALSRSHG